MPSQDLLRSGGLDWSAAELRALIDHIDSGVGAGEAVLEQDLIDFIVAYKRNVTAPQAAERPDTAERGGDRD